MKGWVPPNYEDAEMARYFDRLDFYFRFNEGLWIVRAAVKGQTRDIWPANYRAKGFTMIEAMVNVREVMLAAMRADDLKSDRWKAKPVMP